MFRALFNDSTIRCESLFKMMNFVLNMMDCVFKMMYFVSQMTPQSARRTLTALSGHLLCPLGSDGDGVVMVTVWWLYVGPGWAFDLLAQQGDGGLGSATEGASLRVDVE